MGFSYLSKSDTLSTKFLSHLFCHLYILFTLWRSWIRLSSKFHYFVDWLPVFDSTLLTALYIKQRREEQIIYWWLLHVGLRDSKEYSKRVWPGLPETNRMTSKASQDYQRGNIVSYWAFLLLDTYVFYSALLSRFDWPGTFYIAHLIYCCVLQHLLRN